MDVEKRLNIIKSTPYGMDRDTPLFKDFKWLIEQAEKVEQLEKDKEKLWEELGISHTKLIKINQILYSEPRKEG